MPKMRFGFQHSQQVGQVFVLPALLVLVLVTSGHAFHFGPRNARIRTTVGATTLKKQSEHLREGMEWRSLGESDLVVSQACIGSMMWGDGVDSSTAHEMLNIAFDEFGVNFIDTSELYPSPADDESFGATDRVIAGWLKGRARSDVVLATKVAGYSDDISWLRKSQEAGTRVSKPQIMESLDASLERLGTDYIDLLQVEWPDRYTGKNMAAFAEQLAREDDVSFAEQLEAMRELIEMGKVRAVGICNETPYGLMKFREAAKETSCPVIASVQNPYNLLERNELETHMLEACHYTNTALLAHSPLASGVLTGKYASGVAAGGEDYRLFKYPGFKAKYLSPSCSQAVEAYAAVAEKYGLDPYQLALSWCYSRPFVTSTILGVSTTEQLRDNLMALNCPMTKEMEEDIQALYFNDHRDPSRGSVSV